VHELETKQKQASCILTDQEETRCYCRKSQLQCRRARLDLTRTTVNNNMVQYNYLKVNYVVEPCTGREGPGPAQTGPGLKQKVGKQAGSGRSWATLRLGYTACWSFDQKLKMYHCSHCTLQSYNVRLYIIQLQKDQTALSNITKIRNPCYICIIVLQIEHSVISRLSPYIYIKKSLFEIYIADRKATTCI